MVDFYKDLFQSGTRLLYETAQHQIVLTDSLSERF